MCFRVISVNKDEIENAYNKKIVIEEEVDVPKKIEKEMTNIQANKWKKAVSKYLLKLHLVHEVEMLSLTDRS